eukprot:COSAG06_NODE_1750_length_8437_cov_11.374373_5_plen_65_part_00
MLKTAVFAYYYAGITWTPWSQATDLDATLRKPGWGLVFNGLPVRQNVFVTVSFLGSNFLCHETR